MKEPLPNEQSQAIVVVHGVGPQLRLSTLKAFADGLTANFEYPSVLTRARIADILERDGAVSIEGLPLRLQEINYASEIEQHEGYAEQSPRLWIRSVRNQLRDINRHRGERPESFERLQSGLEDLLMASTLTRFVADRVRLAPTASVDHAAVAFLRQVQLYIDRERYRDDIELKVHERMNELAGRFDRLSIVAHSLGTVVCFRALLRGAAGTQPWVRQVRDFFTFGSPIDLLMALFPEMFPPVHLENPLSIRWTNYNFANDPIATDLSIARHWQVENAAGLFVAKSPEEVHLGAGSLLTAHTDYWRDTWMYQDIRSTIDSPIAATVEGPPEDEAVPPPAKHPAVSAPAVSSLFSWASLTACFVAGWLLILWWEENLKFSDSERVVLLERQLTQTVLWVLAGIMTFSYALCWSGSYARRWGAFILCTVVSLALMFLMPRLPLLEWAPKDALLWGDKMDEWFSVSLYVYGNIILALVPLCGFFGVIAFSSRRSSAPWIPLLIATLLLSLLVGTRTNPSNLSAEIGLLALMFGLWWLGVLFLRIHESYRNFIGGRKHLDALCRLWPDLGQAHRAPRDARKRNSVPVASIEADSAH